MNASPVMFRYAPQRNADDPVFMGAGITICFGPNVYDVGAFHVGEAIDGRDEDEVRVALRKKLAQGLYDSIMNDNWGDAR